MGSLSSKNWGVKYLLCVIDVCLVQTVERWKKVKNGLIEIVYEFNLKPNKL